MRKDLTSIDYILHSITRRWGVSKLILVISGVLASTGITTCALVNVIPDKPEEIDILEEKENEVC